MAKTPFLRDLHSRFGLSRSQVVEVAVRAAGRDVEGIERLARGYDNEVYRVRLAGELVVYVRIRRHSEGTLEQEAWAMGLARAGGVPVPDILAVDPACDAADGHPVMVVAAAPGHQLEEALATAADLERYELLSGVGEMLALLEVSPDPPHTGFVLCHGDVSSEHVFVDARLRVSGLIDWGMWHAGSRIGELASVATAFGWDDLQPVLQGYGYSPARDGNDLQRQLATTLAVQLIGHVAHHVGIGDPDGAASSVAAVRQALHVLDGTAIN